jgi:neutral ceramidase
VYEGVHDPLYARAACIKGDDEFVIVSLDSIGDGIGLTDSIRNLASERTGIPREKVMVSCTHTHTAPETYGLCGHTVDERWLEDAANKVAFAIVQAYRNLEPATMRVGTTRTEGLVVNRRARYVEERARTSEVRLSPEDAARSVDADEDLRVWAFLRADGSLIGMTVNFACHPVIMQTAPIISADYAGFVAEEAERRTGATTIFLNGPCGDINPTCGDTRNYNDVVALGLKLVKYILQVVENFPTGSNDGERIRISTRRAIAEVRRRALPPKGAFIAKREELEDEIRTRGATPPPHEDTLGAALFEVREVLSLYEDPNCYDAEVQVFTLGPHAIFGIPGELFTCLGRDIRVRVAGDALIATLANRILGYIAPQEAFRVGGYEVGSLARWSRLAPGSAEIICDAAIGLLGR